MSKQIPKSGKIYVAPKMLGKYNEGVATVVDERNGDKLDPKDIDDKILIYEREVQGWFLDPASKLLDDNHFNNSFIVLMICMSYIEGVEQYKRGRSSTGASKKYFIDSVNRLYPNKFEDENIKKLYSKSRCGLFHSGMVKGGVVFDNDFKDVITFEDNGETIEINPEKLLTDIKDDFERYICELKISEKFRKRFDKMFSVL
jgi:hypothetical protein